MSSTQRYTKLIDTLFQSANEHLIDRFSQLLDKAPTHLDALAERQKEFSDKEPYFDLRHFVTTNREALRQGFFVSLNRILSFTSDEAIEEEDELSLVSEEEMEEMVAITTLHAHAINRYGEALDHLEARLEYLEISEEYSLHKDCLNPDKIGDALRETLSSFTMEPRQKQDFYNLFDALMITELEPMYQELNAILVGAGILPEIVLRTSRHSVDEEPEIVVTAHRTEITQERTAQHKLAQYGGGLGSVASTVLDDGYVAERTATHLPESFRRPAAIEGEDGQQYYERKEVMNALQRLQKQITEGDKNSIPEFEDIKRTLMRDMASSEGSSSRKSISTMDERNIDLVGMLFSEITEDSTVTTLVRNLLLQLQVPLLRLAMISNELYEREDHPARELLDLIPVAGRGIEDAQDETYQSIDRIVDKLVKQEACDLNSFEQANARLRKLIEIERNLTRKIERQEQRAIVYANARQVIVDEVRHITCKKHIPGNVIPLITRSWPSLMINRYVKHGCHSWEWLESVMLMKLLIKCLQPIRTDSQWQTVWNNHLALVDAVHEELAGTRQDQEAIEKYIEQLKQTFMELLDAYGYKLQEDAESTPMMPAANDDTSDEDLRVTHISDVARSARARLDKLPDHVHPGVWYEIFNGEDKAVRRLKLSVVLTEVGKLIFVDRKGVKVIEKDAADFADELEQQRSRLIADHSTFDQALSRVMGAIAA